MNTHYYIEDPTYAEALRKNALNLVSNAGLHSSSIEPNSPMNSVTEDQSDHSMHTVNMLNTISNNTLLSPVSNCTMNDSALLFGYTSINGLATITGSTLHNQLAPMPPLRSTNLNGRSDKLLTNGYSIGSIGYATLTAPGSRMNNNNLNNINNLNNTQFPAPPTLPNASIGHLV